MRLRTIMGEGEMQKGREGGGGGVKWCTEVRGSVNGMVNEAAGEGGCVTC